MKWVLIVAAVAEAGAGLVLLLLPSVVGQLVFGAELTGIAAIMASVAGIALTALSVACWPGPPRLAMLGYSAGIMVYFAYLGLSGDASGILLWPAVALHVVLTALLARAYLRA